MEEKYVKLMEHLNINLYLVEEELFIKQWIEENQITELTTDLLARYKTAASASAKASDEAGNYKKGDKRFSGINKATRKQFDNDLKKHGQYKESDASWTAAMEKQKENRLTTNDKKKLDQVRALLAKEKKPVKEEMAANCTGAAVATDTPAPLKKDIKKYKNIARRKPLVPGV
jgi:hypothetical protein